LILSVYHPSKADAISGSDFSPGRIIDNSIFENKDALSVQEIQSFLNSKPVNSATGQTGMCDVYGTTRTSHSNGLGGYYTRAQWTSLNFYGHADGKDANGSPILFTCLRDYVENPSTHQNNIWNPTASVPGGVSAAQIIWNAAQAYRINPEVILVTLQKEQGLVTDDWPWPDEYQAAMGYGCPDTAACSTKYYGFYNQVDNAVWQLRYYLDHPGAFNYWVGNNYIQYNPNANCGGSVVNIQNSATAALYIYTPYQPNAAALANVSDSNAGGGDSCSAYGNRNFWWYFTSWFGSTYLTFNIDYGIGDFSVDSTGDEAIIPIRLTGRPISNVAFNFGVTDGSLAKIVGPSSFAFGPSNWNIPQYITVQGLASGANTKDFSLKVLSVLSPDGAYPQSVTPLLNSRTILWSNRGESAVVRLYNSSTGKHAYAVAGDTLQSLLSSGYTSEMNVGYQCPGSTDPPLVVDNPSGLVRTIDSSDIPNKQTAIFSILYSNGAGSTPVSAWRNPAGSDTVLSQDSNATEKNYLSNNGWIRVASFMLCNNGDSPVYRLNDNTNSTHFYTASAAETFSLLGYGFTYEGVAFNVNNANTVPVYRLNDPVHKTHFYTDSSGERDAAQSVGFKYEGIAFYASTGNSKPVYRLNDVIHKTHFYTASSGERDAAQSVGFKYEGIAFYLQ
jgi:hypothetical protein